jgi:stearoyl-CoA desaturase (delta-9 desaturase)
MLIPAFMYGELWMWVAGFLWWQWVAASAISAGYHRYFSHKSFNAPGWYEWYAQIVGLFANPGPVMTWAATHRMHHAYTDSDKDPHSPTIKGFLRVYTSTWGKDITIERKMLKGLNTPSIKFFYKHYFMCIGWLAMILLLIHPALFLFGFCLPVVLAFHGYGIVNVVPHTKAGDPKNSWVANILTGGEGWHKNHHDDSRNWKIGKHWYQLDPGAWFIRLIKR